MLTATKRRLPVTSFGNAAMLFVVPMMARLNWRSACRA